METSIIWSIFSLFISFGVLFGALYGIKPTCVMKMNRKGKKIVDFTKISFISLIIALSVALIVFVFLSKNRTQEQIIMAETKEEEQSKAPPLAYKPSASVSLV